MTPRRKILDFRFGSNELYHEDGTYPVSRETIFEETQAYGWIKRYQSLFERDRRDGVPELRYLVLGFEPAIFRIKIKPGQYKVTLTIGDILHDNHITLIETNFIHEKIQPIRSRRAEYTTISLSTYFKGNHLEIKLDSPCNNWIINRVEIEKIDSLDLQGISKTSFFWDRWLLLPETAHGPHTLLAHIISNPLNNSYILPTGIQRNDYLQEIEDSVFFFAKFQNKNGAIIDPYLNEEFQYATPCFAFACALVASQRNNSELLNASIKAFEWASQSLANRQAATAHEDFYPSPLAHAYAILKNKIDSETRQRWQVRLLSIEPFDTYRHSVGGSGGPGSNWNCKALSGEYLLAQQGLRQSLDFINASLSAQGRFFDNEFGLYSEGPFVYDIFPRAWLYDMLQTDFEGPYQLAIEENLDRGAITSLFMQGPTGTLPAGGRSGLHLWGDALQILVFEIAAARWLRRGQPLVAGIFKRAARKAFTLLSEWKRPSGEHWVLKNKVDPSLRHGYEGYSSHSQYNLLLLTIIGYAYEHSIESESIQERITPSEQGGYVLELPKPFHTVIANASGAYIQITKQGYHHQTPRGLVKLQFLGLHPSLPIPEGSVETNEYHLSSQGSTNLAFGLTWRRNGKEENFFDPRSSKIKTTIHSKKISQTLTKFCISYQLTPDSEMPIIVTEDYELSNRQIHINYSIDGPVEEVELRWPVYQSDGQDESELTLNKNTLNLLFKNHRLRYTCEERNKIALSNDRYAHRSGYIRIATVKLEKKSFCHLTITHL